MKIFINTLVLKFSLKRVFIKLSFGLKSIMGNERKSRLLLGILLVLVYFIFKILFVYVCMCAREHSGLYVYIPLHMCGGQRTTCENQFLLSTM